MSQIDTRITCLLDDEADIRAVFSAVSGAGALRQVLARLDTRQQALIMGHAVPMPVVVRTRTSGTSAFYEEMGARDAIIQRQCWREAERNLEAKRVKYEEGLYRNDGR